MRKGKRKKNKEAYRSGHNGHDWKSCSLHGLRGSNPLASAKKREIRTLVVCVSLFFVYRGFERLGSRRVNETIIISPQRADQTADETAVCETGVIANIVCGANPLASAKIKKYEHSVFVFLYFFVKRGFERL